MAGIGELSVFVSANTWKAQRNLTGFRKTADMTGKSLKRNAKLMDLMGSAGDRLTDRLGLLGVAIRNPLAALSTLTSIVGGAMLTNGLKEAAKDIDNLAKASYRLGTSMANLKGLRLAAEESGQSAATLDMAMQRMIRRVAQASDGRGEAVNAIKQLGLDARELAELDPATQIMKIGDAVARLGNHGQKLAVMQKIFDSEGVGLLQMLEGGEAYMTSMIQKAEKLGQVLNKNDASAVEKLNDTVGELHETLKGLYQTLVADLAPSLDGVFRNLINNLKIHNRRRGIEREAERIQQVNALTQRISSGEIGSDVLGLIKELKDMEVVFREFGAMDKTGLLELAEIARTAHEGILSDPNYLSGRDNVLAQLRAEAASYQRRAVDDWVKTEGGKALGQLQYMGAETVSVAKDTMQKVGSVFSFVSGAVPTQAAFDRQAERRRTLERQMRDSFFANSVAMPKQKNSGAAAALRTAMAGTRDEYALRANMNNQSLQIQNEQLEALRSLEATAEAQRQLDEQMLERLDKDGNMTSLIGV